MSNNTKPTLENRIESVEGMIDILETELEKLKKERKKLDELNIESTQPQLLID